MSSVVLISADRDLRRWMVPMLVHLGWHAITAHDVREASRRPACRAADAAILDLGELDIPLAVQGIRDRLHLPVITTSRRGASALAASLDAGADDHIELPVNLDELGARLRRLLLRRRQSPDPSDIVSTSHFSLDLTARTAFVGATEVHLTRTEWALVDILVRHPDQLITQERLLTAVWGPESIANREYLRVHMHAIRTKLEPDPHHPRYFRTVPGVGLRFHPDQPGVRGLPDPDPDPGPAVLEHSGGPR